MIAVTLLVLLQRPRDRHETSEMYLVKVVIHTHQHRGDLTTSKNNNHFNGSLWYPTVMIPSCSSSEVLYELLTPFRFRFPGFRFLGEETAHITCTTWSLLDGIPSMAVIASGREWRRTMDFTVAVVGGDDTNAMRCDAMRCDVLPTNSR